VLLAVHGDRTDGFELLDALPAETKGVALPVIALTADGTPAVRHRALERGAQDFITKPFDHEELLLRVRNTMDMRSVTARLRRANDDLEARVVHRTFELEQSRLEMLDRLALAAEFRDDDTGEHTRRVARTAMLLAERIGLPPEQTQVIGLAAPLHDVGKIAIPDAILLKPGTLTADEVAVVQRHTIVGGQILAGSSSEILNVAADIALHHHERWDGCGYPARLRGRQIPVAARIVAIADVFDALTHERPYKRPWPVERAVREIASESGAHFDPDIAAAFAGLEHDRLLSLVARPGDDFHG
jgi:putative two-component system response regulator